mmetsp:Transcript_14359/g.12865  ORF Transcript_14359/g.12865 Transcript_14359/m.12865 type:complete len:523 (+) Transcript_14359:127-1695(+)
MLAAIFSLLLLVTSIKAHFLQCDYQDTLEPVERLKYPNYGEQSGVICDHWPFYAGGHPHHPSYDSYSSDSSSSESSEDSSEEASLLPDTVTSDSILYGFDDEVETHQCLDTSSTGYCKKWVTTSQEYEDKGCGRHDKDGDAQLLTEYQLCLCADDNYGESVSFEVSTEAPLTASYCSTWACLEFDSYPAESNAYSLVMDNDFVMSRSWSSDSSSSSSDSDSSDEYWEEPTYNGDYYRFAKDGETMALDESMEFSNCWCKSSGLNGKYCLNWYCESLEHDEYGCHKEGFGVNDYGWFGCYDDETSVDYEQCQQWYGFLVDHEERDEYRCECIDDSCVSWMCGVAVMPLRRNYMWYNFPLAMILWVCLCGCCGTKQCYKRKFSKCNKRCLRSLQCRKCRMFTFFTLFGTISLFHGGVPAFMFFTIFFCLSLCCAKKCENCKCCSKRCGGRKKWASKHDMADTKEMMTTNITSKDGEDSKERKNSVSVESVSVDAEQPKVSKSGHIRVNSVDLDDVEIDADVTQV